MGGGVISWDFLKIFTDGKNEIGGVDGDGVGEGEFC